MRSLLFVALLLLLVGCAGEQASQQTLSDDINADVANTQTPQEQVTNDSDVVSQNITRTQTVVEQTVVQQDDLDTQEAQPMVTQTQSFDDGFDYVTQTDICVYNLLLNSSTLNAKYEQNQLVWQDLKVYCAMHLFKKNQQPFNEAFTFIVNSASFSETSSSEQIISDLQSLEQSFEQDEFDNLSFVIEKVETAIVSPNVDLNQTNFLLYWS